MTEKKEVEKTLDALQSLVAVTLTSERRTKFAEAAKLCTLGQDLVRVTSHRIADMSMDYEEDYAGGGAIYGGRRMQLGPDGPGVYANQPVDHMQVTRDAITMIAKDRGINAAAQEAAELASLTTALQGLDYADRKVVEKRIKNLLENLETRNAAVAHSNLSRGHQPQGPESQPDAAASDGPDSQRNGGHENPPQEGVGSRLVQQALG